VIARINTFFPADRLRPVEEVLASVPQSGSAAS
jgi:hypothetical protein